MAVRVCGLYPSLVADVSQLVIIIQLGDIGNQGSSEDDDDEEEELASGNYKELATMGSFY